MAFVDFSHDDRLLLSGGVPEDRKILIWDMSNGCIVSIVQHDPAPTTVAAWGGMVRCGMKALASRRERLTLQNACQQHGLVEAAPVTGAASRGALQVLVLFVGLLRTLLSGGGDESFQDELSNYNCEEGMFGNNSLIHTRSIDFFSF